MIKVAETPPDQGLNVTTAAVRALYFVLHHLLLFTFVAPPAQENYWRRNQDIEAYREICVLLERARITIARVSYFVQLPLPRNPSRRLRHFGVRTGASRERNETTTTTKHLLLSASHAAFIVDYSIHRYSFIYIKNT